MDQQTAALNQVVCSQCGTGNRVAAGHETDSARCGKCGAPLFSGVPIEVNDAAFERHLKLTQGLILVDVWAPWCGPCRMMGPHFAEVAHSLAGQAVFLKMNADDNTTPAKLGVRGIPTLILFRNGREIERKAGLMNAQALRTWVQSAL